MSVSLKEQPESAPAAMDTTVRLTAAQALVRYLKAQYSERDGVRRRAVPAAFGIFGHGNVCGVGQALEEVGGRELPYHQPKNEQSMVHTAIGFAKASNRLATLACTASIGPGSTNMITGAATATVNRVPVLLLPSDTFANRRQGPVLQQLEHPVEADVSVSDCFRPVSRFFDRITRPEQLLTALPQAMRVLLDPVEAGAVTISLHQDVQGEAYAFPARFFEPRTWTVARRPPAQEEVAAAVDVLAQAQRPVLIAGGGARYADAAPELRRLAEDFGVPIAETFAGKSVTPATELLVGGLGVTGTQAAYEIVRDADVVLCVGTRLADFTTGSHSIFQHPDVRFVGVNVSPSDAYKLGATPVVADAKLALQAIMHTLADRGWATDEGYRSTVASARRRWEETLAADRVPRDGEGLTSGQLLEVLNEQAQPGDLVVAAAGSPPSDLLRVWDASGGASCMLEFGYSCMGHEIPAGIGARMARPDAGEVYVVIGDGTYLMANTELVTAAQEQRKVTVVVIDNHGYQCIRALQIASTGADFGNEFRTLDPDDERLTGDWLPVDYVGNAQSLGVTAFEADDAETLREALAAARDESRPVVIVSRVEPYRTIVGSDCWWDLGVPHTSTRPEVERAAGEHLRRAAERQRFYG
jgi:3D-(3,5/4)-trihydroxycyclohexane-1,2-dione acylhydrolase (decyclizing)